MIKINKIRQKAGYLRVGPRGCYVALRATWRCHVDPRGAATWTHAAPSRRCDGCAIFIFITI